MATFNQRDADRARAAVADFVGCAPEDLAAPWLVDGIYVTLQGDTFDERGLPVTVGGSYYMFSPETGKVAPGGSLPPETFVPTYRDLVD